MRNPTYLLLITTLLLSFMGMGCEEDSGSTPSTDPGINERIASEAEFSQMKEAMDHANLGPTLNGRGPYTVFVPTNEAFEDYIASEGVNSIREIRGSTLSRLLLPHILQGTLPGDQLNEGYISTIAVENSSLNSVNLYFSPLTGINGEADIDQTDIVASNGLIHTVDALIPFPNLWTHLQANLNFSDFFAACNQAGSPFREKFINESPFTLFVPSNSAMDAFLLNHPEWNNDLSAIPRERLEAIISLHVVPNQNVGENQFTDGLGLNTMHDGGNTVLTLVENSGLFEISKAGGGTVVISGINIQATNGIIHIIDEVLIP